MKHTFIGRFHVINFKLEFSNDFIFFPPDIISLFPGLLQFFFCKGYKYKVWIN